MFSVMKHYREQKVSIRGPVSERKERVGSVLPSKREQNIQTRRHSSEKSSALAIKTAQTSSELKPSTQKFSFIVSMLHITCKLEKRLDRKTIKAKRCLRVSCSQIKLAVVALVKKAPAAQRGSERPSQMKALPLFYVSSAGH